MKRRDPQDALQCVEIGIGQKWSIVLGPLRIFDVEFSFRGFDDCFDLEFVLNVGEQQDQFLCPPVALVDVSEEAQCLLGPGFILGEKPVSLRFGIPAQIFVRDLGLGQVLCVENLEP